MGIFFRREVLQLWITRIMHMGLPHFSSCYVPHAGHMMEYSMAGELCGWPARLGYSKIWAMGSNILCALDVHTCSTVHVVVVVLPCTTTRGHLQAQFAVSKR